MQWAKAIKSYRVRQNLTAERLSEQLGVSPRTVQRWEASDSRPTKEVAVRIKDFIFGVEGITVDEALLVLVETCVKPAMLYNRNAELVATSPAHQALFRYKFSDIAGLPSVMLAPPETRKMLEDMGPKLDELKNVKTLTRLWYRARREPGDQFFNPIATVMTKANFYITRDDNGTFIALLMIADILNKKEYDELPSGLQFE